jgi:hypothetical protein
MSTRSALQPPAHAQPPTGTVESATTQAQPLDYRVATHCPPSHSRVPTRLHPCSRLRNSRLTTYLQPIAHGHTAGYRSGRTSPSRCTASCRHGPSPLSSPTKFNAECTFPSVEEFIMMQRGTVDTTRGPPPGGLLWWPDIFLDAT